MKNIIEVETAEELIKLCNGVRAHGDDKPYISPQKNTLVIDNGIPRLQSENGEFQLSKEITEEQIYQAMAKSCNMVLHIT